jgi:hypothetical protein
MSDAMSDDTQTQEVSVPAKTRMLAAMMTGYIEATREAMAAVVKATWNPELRDEAHEIYSIFDDGYEDGYKDNAQHQQDHATQQEQQDHASKEQEDDSSGEQEAGGEKQDDSAANSDANIDAKSAANSAANSAGEVQYDVQCEVQDDDAVVRKGHGEFRALALALESSIPRTIAVLNQFVRSGSFEPSNDAHIEARNLLDDLQGDALKLQGTSLFQVVLAPDPKADVTL